MITHLGKWTTALIDGIIHEAAALTDIGGRIDFISRQLLNTPYKEASLSGSVSVPEVLIINLEGVDCITFIEYVEAMRLSGSYSEFTKNLKMVRYRNGAVTYEGRRHFFSDWVGYTPKTVDDVTSIIGAKNTVRIMKNLNLRSDGTFLLHGICVTQREISFIPVNAINSNVMARLMTGDYAGIYSGNEGLDVTHTGIIIKDGGRICLRHASSRKDTYKVIDEELTEYLTGKAGIIILRPI
ncbi:MAG: DUF1460 domain-containing protein [Nitrospirae bacterium]|nr:DUF1460 domain-containing protein [Nitrospirota bacterium]